MIPDSPPTTRHEQIQAFIINGSSLCGYHFFSACINSDTFQCAMASFCIYGYFDGTAGVWRSRNNVGNFPEKIHKPYGNTYSGIHDSYRDYDVVGNGYFADGFYTV